MSTSELLLIQGSWMLQPRYNVVIFLNFLQAYIKAIDLGKLQQFAAIPGFPALDKHLGFLYVLITATD